MNCSPFLRTSFRSARGRRASGSYRRICCAEMGLYQVCFKKSINHYSPSLKIYNNSPHGSCTRRKRSERRCRIFQLRPAPEIILNQSITAQKDLGSKFHVDKAKE